MTLLALPFRAIASEGHEGKLDIPEIVLEHLSDAYEWHIASYDGKSIGFELPIIVRSAATGAWTCCTAHTLPDNYFFDAAHHGKIYERMPDGTAVRPLDLSLTKVVVQIWIAVILLLTLFVTCARWYKRHDVERNRDDEARRVSEHAVRNHGRDVGRHYPQPSERML